MIRIIWVGPWDHRVLMGGRQEDRVRVASVLMEAGQGGVPLSQGRHAASEAGNDKD